MVRTFAAVMCLVGLLSVVPRLNAQSGAGQAAVRRPAPASQAPRGTAATNVGRTRVSDEPESGVAGAPAAAQPAGVGATIEMKGKPQARRAPPMSAAQEAELDVLLEKWSKASGNVFRMEGDIQRRVYDLSFKTERFSQGSFAYEQPDCGRVNFKSARVTPQDLERRAAEVAAAKKAGTTPRIRLKEDGEPFDLVESSDTEWWCNGTRVFDLDVQKKQALVASIPADMQGKNIMDSPLPFLFGMPPEKARRRYEMAFHQGKSPASDATMVHLVIYPNLPQDAGEWHHVNLMLDTQNWLPVAVQMYDPPQTGISVYTFSNVQVNQTDWIRNFWPGRKPTFEPNLPPGWNIIPVGDDGGVESDVDNGIARNGAPEAPKAPRGQKRPAPQIEAGRIPDLTGLPHKEALEILNALGLPRDDRNPKASRVSLQQGQPAATPAAIYTVESQDPQPGTEIKPNTRVTVRLFTDPDKAPKSAKSGSARVN